MREKIEETKFANLSKTAADIHSWCALFDIPFNGANLEWKTNKTCFYFEVLKKFRFIMLLKCFDSTVIHKCHYQGITMIHKMIVYAFD